MNYGQLKTAVLDEAHRPDLTAEVAGFIRRAEGMIRRRLIGYELAYTLDEDDRDVDGVYDLPSNVLVLRSVFTVAGGDSYAVENCGAPNVRSYSLSAPVLVYAVRGAQIEFRGAPGAGQELELAYFGHPPALSADSDENALLTDHEALYLEGALFYLYKHTQDLELAQGALDVFEAEIDALNDAHHRKVAAGSTQGHYNFGQSRPAGSSM